MASSVNLQPETKTSPVLALKGHVYTMMAAFAGVVLGVLGSMGFVSNMLSSQFAAQNAALDKRLVAVAPASDMTACYGTSSASTGGAGGEVAGASAVAHEETGGKGGDSHNEGGKGGGDFPMVHQIVDGTISNTGPNSHNSINATNKFTYTVNNKNDVKVDNKNSQDADSGDATVSSNTNGGSAQSGDADNYNSQSTWINVTN